MITLRYVLLEQHKQLKLYETSAFLPDDALQMSATGDCRVYLVVSDDANNWYTIDLRKYVFSRDQLAGYVTWAACLTGWEQSSIWPIAYDSTNPSQHVPIPKFVYSNTDGPTTTSLKPVFVESVPWYKTPKICGCDASRAVGINYGAPNSVYPLTRPFWKFHRDIVFSSEIGTALTLDFANCVPICGGSAYYPQVVEGCLYAKDAVFSLWPTYRHNLNYFLFDFTPVGGMTVLRFSDCLAVEIINDWVKVVVPDNVVLTNHSVILSLYGKLQLLGKYAQRVNDNTLMISMELLRSHGICLDQLRSTNRTVNRTMAVMHAQDNTTILSDLNTAYHTFIIIVNTSKLVEHQLDEIDHLTKRVHRFPRGARGLLRNKITGHIQDYVHLDYQSDTVLIAQEERSLLVPKGQSLDHPMQRLAVLHNRNGATRFFNDCHYDAPWALFEWLTTQELIDNAT